jgi:hypothetical protein
MKYIPKRDSGGKFIPVIINRTKICEYCGKEFTPSIKNFARNKFCSLSCSSKSRPSGRTGKKNSQYQKDMVSLKLSREKHGRWIKDRSKVKVGDRCLNDPLQKQWRLNVYKKDGYKCRMENKDCNGGLEAHHILPWKDYPELRFDVENGITICHYHHPRKKDEVKNLSNKLKNN